MSTDPFDRLSEVALPAPTTRLETVQRRAGALRRARRARVVVGSGALALTLVVGGAVLPRSGDGQGSEPAAVALGLGVAPARADGGPCSDPSAAIESYAEWLDRESWAQEPGVPELVSLVGDTRWPLQRIGVTRLTGDCPENPPTALWVTEDPVQGVAVWADVADPFPAGTDEEGTTAVRVRGVDGLVRDFVDAQYLSWVEPDGVRWMVSGSGMSQADLLDLLGALRLDGTTVDPGSGPRGMEQVEIAPGARSTTSRSWRAEYGDPGAFDEVVHEDGSIEAVPVPDAGVALEVGAAGRPPEITAAYWAPGTVFVDIDGVRGVFAPWGGDPESDDGGWLEWQRDGLSYRLSGAVPLETLRTVAAGVHTVGLDDPALVGAEVYTMQPDPDD